MQDSNSQLLACSHSQAAVSQVEFRAPYRYLHSLHLQEHDFAQPTEESSPCGLTNLNTILNPCAGDSHTVALTSLGALYAWGTFRGDSGPWAFLPGVKFALQPTLVYEPKSYKEQIVEISSGFPPYPSSPLCVSMGSDSDSLLLILAGGCCLKQLASVFCYRASSASLGCRVLGRRVWVGPQFISAQAE